MSSYDPNNPVHVALRAANEADEAYSRTIQRMFGPKVTRWTMTPEQNRHPEIREALRRKLDADVAFSVAFGQAYQQSKERS